MITELHKTIMESDRILEEEKIKISNFPTNFVYFQTEIDTILKLLDKVDANGYDFQQKYAILMSFQNRIFTNLHKLNKLYKDLGMLNFVHCEIYKL